MSNHLATVVRKKPALTGRIETERKRVGGHEERRHSINRTMQFQIEAYNSTNNVNKIMMVTILYTTTINTY